MDEQKVWNKVLEKIKNEISGGNFNTWFKQTKFGGIEDESITIFVPSAFVQDQLIKRYERLLKETITAVYSKDLNLIYKVDPSKFAKSGKVEIGENEEIFFDSYPQTTIASPNIILNPKFSLENFVVGLTNNLAFAAAQAVVANPGISYNPLFIYGPSGVGKTHLMQGIGNALITKNPTLKLVYVSSERFMNDLVESIQTKKTGDFRQKYRNCDVFLIDDIQFISGRDSTQEEFFHTFNELQGKNSQLVMTSDRPPKEIQKLEPRLASRFAGGLMVDIQLPDIDTRMAILKAKLNERGETLPEDILSQIAENSDSSIRELEGKLIQILQISKATPDLVNSQLISRYIGSQTAKPQNQGNINQDKVIPAINQFFNIQIEDLIGPRRQKELVLPRQIAMYILYEDCKLPFERIGSLLGGRDHTTIMHGVEKIKELQNRDREIQRLLIEVRQQIK